MVPLHGKKQIWLVYLRKHNEKEGFFWSTTIKKNFSLKKKNLKKFLKDQKIKNFFNNKKRKIIIEIGPGIGENLFYLANKYPRKRVIGVEPFKNGLANIADVCITNKIKNVYLFPHVFQKFIDKFKNYFFDQCYIFFPDPWPKKKHMKRRLVNYIFLNELVLRCSSKGSIFFCSDNLDYFEKVKNYANVLKKKGSKILVKSYKKTPTIVTKYHNRALKLRNNVNFLKIDKI